MVPKIIWPMTDMTQREKFDWLLEQHGKLQAEITRLRAENVGRDEGWQPMETMPTDGTPFLAAVYAPTSWSYHIHHIKPPPYMEGETLKRFLERGTRYARGWMPAPPECGAKRGADTAKPRILKPGEPFIQELD